MFAQKIYVRFLFFEIFWCVHARGYLKGGGMGGGGGRDHKKVSNVMNQYFKKRCKS